MSQSHILMIKEAGLIRIIMWVKPMALDGNLRYDYPKALLIPRMIVCSKTFVEISK